jgi:hypothetical protein
MPTGVQLSQMISDLRSELGHSVNVAHGVNTKDNMAYVLRRTQEVLYEEHDWPFLLVDRTITAYAGQYLYNYPADMPFEVINGAWWKEGSYLTEMDYGITIEDFNLYDTSEDQRSNPVQKWRHRPDEGQFEVWPVPSLAGEIRFRGSAPLSALIDDADPCTLDSNLIVLHTAAELLARQKSEDAPLKASLAGKHLVKLLSNQGAQKRRPWVIGGGGGAARGRPGIDYIPTRG